MARVRSTSCRTSSPQPMWKANYTLLATLLVLVMAAMASAASPALVPEQGNEVGTGRFLLQAGSVGGGRRLLNGNSCSKCKETSSKNPSVQCCDGRCIDVGADEEHHCGACNKKCSFGLDCCAGKCVDKDTDRNNCKKCGNRCFNNKPCYRGMCGYNSHH